MKFYNTFKKGDGSYRTYEFSAQEMLNLDIITFLVVGSICAFLSTIASAILIIVTVNDFEREGVKPSIWGSLIGIYWLVDIYNHWVIWIFLRLFESEKWISIFTNFNVAYLITHLYLVILGTTVFYNVPNPDERKPILVIATIGVFVGSILLAFAFN